MNYSQSIQRLLSNSFFSYAAIALLQLKVVWRMWDYRDLTSGQDIANYFRDAYRWFDSYSVNIIWSPLYTAFYGTLLHIFSDAYVVTTLHRLIIVFASSLMVLALMRKLLPYGIALLVSAWWTILPINFNTLYEVHLFSVIPTLAACLLILSKQAIWARGGALAILAGSTVLVRNELSVATLLLAIVCVCYEIWERKRVQTSTRSYIFAYGLPLILAGLIVLFFYARSYLQFPDPKLAEVAEIKHVLNICQVYAFGYQQRHPEWNFSPWTECYGLMEQTFGKRLPSLFEAIEANPSAMLEHFWWNTSLTLNGIQLSLFNATSGTVNPDYIPVQLNASWVIGATIAVGLIISAGVFQLYRNRQFWWESWLKQRILGWLVLFSVAAVTVFLVIPTQRPRPSYMFALEILLMAIVGMSFTVITHQWSVFKRLNVLTPIIIVALLISVPNYYTTSERRLLDFYHKFQPFQAVMADARTVFLTSEFEFELCSFLGKAEACQPLAYANTDFFAEVPEKLPLRRLLNQKKVNLFYVDENLLAQLESDERTARFLSNPDSMGWKLIAMQDTGDRWKLFQKRRRNQPEADES